jgi:hypothetical protein
MSEGGMREGVKGEKLKAVRREERSVCPVY